MAIVTFEKDYKLCHDLISEDSRIFVVSRPQDRRQRKQRPLHRHQLRIPVSARPVQSANTLPGDPRIGLEDADIGTYLGSEFITEVLNKLAPHLWLMTIQDSKNISSLAEQLAQGREVVVLQNPGLHLVWVNKRVFLKPLPRYFLSHAFWMHYLVKPNAHIAPDVQEAIARAARGFLRTYAYLIQHESDFILATQKKTRLIPEDITYDEFVTFISRCQVNIDDRAVSPRYRFGELRLLRRNSWCRIFLLKARYYEVGWEYGAYFAQFYAPILFVFGVFSLLMSGMQVVLAVRTVLTPDDVWLVFARAARGFSLFTIIFVACVITGLLFILEFSILRVLKHALKHFKKKTHSEACK